MSTAAGNAGLRVLVTIVLLVAAQAARCELALTRSEAGIFSRHQNDWEMILPTSRVEGKVGAKFGITFSVDNKQAGSNPVKYLYLTPGYVEPGGARRDKIELPRDLSVDADTHTMAFEFAESQEIAYGKWIMMVFEGDRLITRAEFDVVIPEESLD